LSVLKKVDRSERHQLQMAQQIETQLSSLERTVAPTR
jgi:hypothetical protein